MENKRIELKVGFVSILAALVLIIGLSLGNNINFGSDLVPLEIIFPNSGGLSEGDPVMINGLERGKVSEMTSHPNGIKVTALLDSRADIKKDAKAKIMMFEITGGRKIEIHPGSAQDPLASSETIVGKTAANMSDLIASVGDIAIDAGDLIKRLDTISASLSLLVNDHQFIADIKDAASQADSLLGVANEFLYNEKDNLHSAIIDLKEISSKLNLAIDKNEPEITEMIGKLNGTVDKVNEFLTKTDNTFNGVDKLIKDLNSIVSDIKSNEATLGRLIYDEEFAKRFDNAISELGKLVSQINEYGINVNARLGTRP